MSKKDDAFLPDNLKGTTAKERQELALRRFEQRQEERKRWRDELSFKPIFEDSVVKGAPPRKPPKNIPKETAPIRHRTTHNSEGGLMEIETRGHCG